MSAKEMFEKLGYDYYENEETYLKGLCFPDKLNTEYILFKKIEKIDNDNVIVRFYKTDSTITEFEELPVQLSKDELKAMAGWLDEDKN